MPQPPWTRTRFEPRASLRLASHWLRAQGFAQPGDTVVMLSASVVAKDAADTLQVMRVEDEQ